MDFTQRKRIEIVTETALLRSIQLRFKDLGVTGYSVLSVHSGRGVVSVSDVNIVRSEKF